MTMWRGMTIMDTISIVMTNTIYPQDDYYYDYVERYDYNGEYEYDYDHDYEPVECVYLKNSKNMLMEMLLKVRL